MSLLTFQGSNCFRQRVVLSLLSGKTIKIDSFRETPALNGNDLTISNDIGVNSSERNLLDLINKLTSSTSVIEINKTGASVTFKPGTIHGGQITHDCCNDRSISYYLEVLIYLGPFCKKPLVATLNGVTNDPIDPSVDALKVSSLPILKRFIGDHEGQKLELKVAARGFMPEGGGQVVFTCPLVRQLLPIQLTNPGKIKRVRGVAIAARVSPQMANRMIDVAKGIILQYIPDIYIYSDHHRGKSSGKSPGFALVLSAETTEGYIYTSDAVSNPKGSPDGPSLPEQVAEEAAHRLFEEIYRGGCVDSINQGIALTCMSFNQKDVSKLMMGPLSMYSAHYLRHIRQFTGLSFMLDSKDDPPRVLCTCVGLGYSNLSRPTY
ncbi:RNA 3'-terminal phosphate cyclase-like protein, partial [Fragariocoptes setiger]